MIARYSRSILLRILNTEKNLERLINAVYALMNITAKG